MTASAIHTGKKTSAARNTVRLLATTAMVFAFGLPAALAQSNPPPTESGAQNQAPLTKKQKDERDLNPIRPIRRVGPKDWPTGKHPAPAAASTQTKPEAEQRKAAQKKKGNTGQTAEQSKSGRQSETTGTASHETAGAAAATNQNSSAQKSNAAAPPSKPSGKADNASEPAAHRNLASIRLGTDAGGRVRLGIDQRKQVEQIIKRHRVRPTEAIAAAVKIGDAPPAAAVLTPVPADLVEVLPQFRGNRYFATADGLFIVDRNTVIAEIPVKPVAVATTHAQTHATARSEHRAPRSSSRSVAHDVTVGVGTADDEAVDQPVTVYRERVVPAPVYRSRRVVVEPPDERTIVLDRPGVTLERVPAGRQIYIDEDD